MIGGSMIDHNIYRDAYWNAHDEYNPYTFNYYVNITIFPWLEVAYTCTLVKGIHGAAIGRPRHGASLPTKTVRFMAACVCGKKVGGSHGLRRSC